MLLAALNNVISDPSLNNPLSSAEVSLYVHINHRRQGLGKILMNKIIEKADEIGIHAIVGKPNCVYESNDAHVNSYIFSLYHDRKRSVIKFVYQTRLQIRWYFQRYGL